MSITLCTSIVAFEAQKLCLFQKTALYWGTC